MTIQALPPITPAQKPAGLFPGETGAKPFGDVLHDALENVRQLEDKVNQNTIDLATANIDDLHNVAIDLTKAQLSVQMVVQVRNKLLDAYSELTRMNL